MTGCRASALLAALVAALPSLAQAQGGPIRLTPPPISDPQPLGGPSAPPASTPPADATPAEATPANPPPADAPGSPPAPAPAGPIVREEGTPRALNFDAVGIAEPRDALPGTLWAGSRRRDIDTLLREGPGAQASPALHELLRRALISAGAPPDPAGTEEPRPFLGLRALRLLRLGETEDALKLARAGGRRDADAAAARVRRDAAFLSGDVDAACFVTREAVTQTEAPDWPLALVACQALAGDLARAQLGLDMQREAKRPEDPWLGRLLAALGGDSSALAQPPGAPLAAYALPLLAAAKLSPPAGALAGADPATLAAIARLPSATPEIRLAAAERAAALGALDGDELAEAYAAVPVSPRDAADPFAFAERERGARGRAALYQHAKAQPPGPARAEALRRSLRLAQARGAGAAFALAAAPVAAEIRPAAELAATAPDLARALLATGHGDEALAWHDALRAGVGPAALDAAALIGPLAWLGGVEDDALISLESLAEWRLAQEQVDKPRAGARSATLALLLDSLGQPAATLLPSASIVAPEADERLATAAREHRLGETALLAAAKAAPDGAAKLPPPRLSAILRALVAAGFAAEARALALEAALAAGL